MMSHQAEASETGYAGVKEIREKSNENLQQEVAVGIQRKELI